MKFWPNLNRRQDGFTLTEVLVAIFIIGVLSAIILSNYRTGQEQASLTRAAAQFETSLRNAQDLATSSQESSGATPCGFGLHYIDASNYSIYAGRLGGSASCVVSNHNFESGADAVHETAKIIEQKVVFKNSFPDIFFEPPDPATYIDNSKASGVSTTIQFCLERDLSVCRNLTINTASRIIIQ